MVENMRLVPADRCGCVGDTPCRLCVLEHRRRTIKALPVVEECSSLGGILERCHTCNGEGRHVRECDRFGKCTLAFVSTKVASCDRCEYNPRRVSDIAWLVEVPKPPQIVRRRPASKTAVVTVMAGTVGRRLLELTGRPMRQFARRVGADFIVSDWEGSPAWPISAKFAVSTALDHYDRILYADADVLFRPGCVNPFDLCAADEFGAADELPWHSHPDFSKYQVISRYMQVCRELGVVTRPPWYLNLGVYVASRTHQRLLEAPTNLLPRYHCAEQDLINARILATADNVRLLDRRCNWQHWTDHSFRYAPPDAILHWSGGGHDEAARLESIRTRLH